MWTLALMWGASYLLIKYGLDHAALRSENPRLIYCSITGFGQTGPLAHRAGYDYVAQAMGGFMELTGEPDGPPQKAGVAYADIFTGVYAVVAVLAALRRRDATGQGAHVDMALLDTMTGVLANQAMNWFLSGVTPPRVGNAHMNVSPYAVFPTADGWFILAVGNDAQFHRFCAVTGLDARPEWATNPGRIAHRGALFAAIEALDNGKTFSWAKKADVTMSIGTIRYYAGWADKIQGNTIETSKEKIVYTTHEPLGVVGQIIPWNFPRKCSFCLS